MNKAIFSLMHDLFLRGLAFAEPSRVVRIYGEAKERDLKQLPFSVPKFWHYRDGQNVFSSIAADWRNGFIMTGQGDPVQLLGANVTANYFDLLGIRPILGRNFLPQEELNADVTLVTESFWRKRFNSDAMVLGRSITLNGIATTIVGVLPDLPISWFGRNSEIFVTKPFEPSGIVTGNLRPAFTTLLAAVGAVLLIACSNVANLLLVRFTGRRREIALRMALGAERRRIVGLFVLESALVSTIAGAIGLCLALWTVSVVPRVAGNNIPLESPIALQWPVLVFTLVLSLITGLAMGLYPAWQSSRADLVDGLKDGGRAVSGSHGQHRFHRGLVTAQVGLSVVLVAAAAMLIASFFRRSRQEAGFRSDQIRVGALGLPPAQHPGVGDRVRCADGALLHWQP